MCGIVGVMDVTGRPVDRGALSRMTGALNHRGPDGQGIHLFASQGVHVGLGHTRLKIIDLSDAAAQPMASDDQSVWLVFNGEIYNFQALRSSLQARGVTFRTTSDTEVLLRLYEQEGARCVERLDGMFAFAIWDGRQGRLLLARDRVGKKPLFYAATPTGFAFASEIKALWGHPEIPLEVDREALPAFFLYGYAPTPSTFYRGIHALAPGHLLEVDRAGQVRAQSYWDLPTAGKGSAHAPSEPEAIAQVRELVTAAVRRRLISDVPLGAFLSGGIDSSVVVGLMSQLMASPVKTFSIGFAGDARFDETSYARLVARRFRTAHTEFIVDPSAIDLLERLVWHYDGPFADSSAVPTYLLSRLTRGHVTVALTGDGGDEVFAGYLRFYAAILAERVPLAVRRAAHRVLSACPEWGDHRSLFRRAQKFSSSALLPLGERFSRWIAVFYEDLPRLLAQGGDGTMASELLGPVTNRLIAGGQASPLDRLLALNLKTYLLDDLLVKMDRCSMAHGLETRSPLLDRALIEYVWSLPDSMKLRHGQTKVILRKAFADLLPGPILRRGKMGFGVPLRRWFKGDLRAALEERLLDPSAKLRSYVNQDYVRELCEAHVTGRADHAHRLWTLLTFETWLRLLPTWAAARGPRAVPPVPAPRAPSPLC